MLGKIIRFFARKSVLLIADMARAMLAVTSQPYHKTELEVADIALLAKKRGGYGTDRVSD